MNPILLAPIASADAARAYLRALVDADLAYHAEESASEIISGRTGEALFTPEECVQADARMAEVHSFLPDPCADLMEMLGMFS